MDFQKAAEPIVIAAGTTSELERWQAGVLPDSELVFLVARHLWKNLQGFRARKRLNHEDVEALAVDRGLADPGTTVTFEAAQPIAEFRAPWWDTFQEIKKRAPAGAEVSSFQITAICGNLFLEKPYARIVVWVGDRSFKLDLCLD